MPAAISFEDVLSEHMRELGQPGGWAPVPVAGTAAAYGFFWTHAAASSVMEPRTGCRAGLPRRVGAWDARHTFGCDLPTAGAPSGRCVTAGGPADASDTRSADPTGRHSPGDRPRSLSSREREALQVLLTLGAALTDDFDADALRTAFRALARKYHPDSHPRCTDAQRAQLCLLFGHAYAAYQTLAGRVRV